MNIVMQMAMDAGMMGPAMSRFNKISTTHFMPYIIYDIFKILTPTNEVKKTAGVHVSATMFKYIWRVDTMMSKMENEEQIMKERFFPKYLKVVFWSFF